MYVANNESLSPIRGVINYMPQSIRRYLFNINLTEAYEIRLRLGKPLSIYFTDGCYYLSQHGVLTQDTSSSVRITHAHIEEALEIASRSSVYSVEDEIREGYITVGGGIRIGICGSAVMSDGKISFVKDISGLNYRLACDVMGASDKISDKIMGNGTVKNTLIISPPGAGKTTMLRDLTRKISYAGFNVSVVDERREIAAMSGGKSAFDLGPFTDVLSGAPKSEGMLMVLRSMAPDVIVTDEIGKIKDCEAIEKIINSGVKIVTTVHGKDEEQIKKRSELTGAMQFFEVFVTLSRRNGAGTVEKITSN